MPPSFTTFSEQPTTNGEDSARPVEPPSLNRQSPRTGHRYALRNWKVRTRLVALILVPTLAAVVLAGLRVATSLQTSEGYARTYELAQIDERVVDLILGLQDERDEMGRFVVNGRAADDRELVQGRAATTDGLVQAYREQVGSFRETFDNDHINSQLDQIESRLSRLKEIRAAGLDTQIQAPTATEPYTSIINDLLDFNGEIGQNSKDDEIIRSVRALDALARMEEFAARQRGLLFRAISNGAFGPNELEELGVEQARRDSALGDFRRSASPVQLALYDRLLSGSEARDTARLKDQVSAAAAAGQNLRDVRNENNQLINADVWFQTAKGELDLLRAVERQVIQDLNNRSQQLQDDAQRSALLDTLVVAVVLFLAFLGISIMGRSMTRPLRRLRGSAFEVAESRLPEIVRRLEDGETHGEDINVELVPVNSRDEIGEVARAFDAVHAQAVRLAVEQAELRSNVNAMFVNLSRRSQGLVERQLRLIEDLENAEQDPDQLGNLFRLDHLATRMRRNGENLLVLAGEEPERRWSQPVALVDVIRAAISEVEQYERIELTALPDVEIAGRAVNDVVHLLAEVLENATVFSSGDTRVNVAGHVLGSGGVMIEVEDQGIGIEPGELEAINERLTNPPVIDVSVSRRMGLFVVGRLAHRHGIRVRLRAGASGGIAALVALSPDLVTFTSGAIPVGAGANRAPGVPQVGPGPLRPAQGSLGGGSNPFGLSLGPRPELPAGETAGRNGAGAAEAGFDGRPSAPLQQSPPAPPGRPPLTGTVLPPADRVTGPPPQVPAPLAGGEETPGSGPIPQPPGTGGIPRPPHSGPIPQPPGTGDIPRPPVSGPIARPSSARQQGAAGETPVGPPRPLGAGGPEPPPGRGAPTPSGPETHPHVPAPQRPLPGHPLRQLPPLTAAERARASGGSVPGGDVLDPAAAASRADRDAEPIFADVQSEWFRHRDRRAAPATREPYADGRSGGPPEPPAVPVVPPAPPTPAAGVPVGAVAGTGEPAESPPTMPPAPAQPEVGQPAPEPAAVGSAQSAGAGGERPHYDVQPPVEEDVVWTSPADSGWAAAAVAAAPTVGGYTAAGLPRRIPKSNLVPGAVGGSTAGQGRHAQRSAEEVRGRLSSFHRGTRRARGEGQDEDLPHPAATDSPTGADPERRGPAEGSEEQENA